MNRRPLGSNLPELSRSSQLARQPRSRLARPLLNFGDGRLPAAGAQPRTYGIFVQLAAAVLLGCISGPLPLALSSLLPPEVRTTGVGTVYSVVGTIFGGLGPLIITAAIAATGDLTAPAWWAASTGAVGAVAALALWRDWSAPAPS